MRRVRPRRRGLPFDPDPEFAVAIENSCSDGKAVRVLGQRSDSSSPHKSDRFVIAAGSQRQLVWGLYDGDISLQVGGKQLSETVGGRGHTIRFEIEGDLCPDSGLACDSHR